MNKLSINVLCVVILVIITFGIIEFSGTFFKGVSDGIQSSGTRANMDYPVLTEIEYTSSDGEHVTDSIVSSKGKYAFSVSSGIIYITQNDVPSYLTVSSMLLPLIGLVLLVWLVIVFIRFIININGEHIFEKKNVKYLQKIGIILLLIGLSEICSGLIDDCIIKDLGTFQTPVSMSAEWSVPWSNILLGLVSLLMSIIWNRGIRMQEEQELTI